MTPALTLAAEFWRRHRFGLAGVIALVVTFAVSSAISPLAGQDATIHSMWFVMGLAYAIGVFAYGFDGKLESPDSGFPARLFVLPVRTSVLVAGPMIQGVLVAALLWVGWDRLVLRPAGIGIPLWWTALIASIVAVSQALVWLPFGVPFLRILVMIVALTALIRAPIVLERLSGDRYAHPDTQANILTTFSLALLPLSYLVAFAGVARARRGDTPSWLPAPRSSAAPTAGHVARPFRSAAWAQMWYEWRARGRGFVLTCALIVVALALLGALLERDPERQTNYGVVFLLMPIFIATFWGPVAGTAGAAARDRGGLSPFAATRPFGNATFVGIKFRSAAVATAAAWAVVVGLLAMWWSYTGRPLDLRPVWDRAVERFGTARAAAGCALLVTAPILLTFRTYLVGMCTGLTGRRWFMTVQLVLGSIVALQMGYEWTKWQTDPARRDRVLDLLPYVAAGAVVLKFTLTIWIIAILRRKGELDRPTLARLIALWLLTAASLIALLTWLLPTDFAPTYALILTVLLVPPLARPLAAPLAFAWNRHR